jgi:hypothetical protein
MLPPPKPHSTVIMISRAPISCTATSQPRCSTSCGISSSSSRSCCAAAASATPHATKLSPPRKTSFHCERCCKLHSSGTVNGKARPRSS